MTKGENSGITREAENAGSALPVGNTDHTLKGVRLGFSWDKQRERPPHDDSQPRCIFTLKPSGLCAGLDQCAWRMGVMVADSKCGVRDKQIHFPSGSERLTYGGAGKLNMEASLGSGRPRHRLPWQPAQLDEASLLAASYSSRTLL